ncbi:hypothetical protein [Bacillus sp. EB01]|uniref:hypothetical protein n=1 Tax=Bacillus sp. EB01 TaxID=1347086 RepID=UPI0005C7396E|nr:hypothetical protein [Bacillus sp. EB01]
MRSMFIFLLGFGMLLAGCSTKASFKEVEVYKAEDISFEDGSGRVTISFEDAMLDDGAIVDGIIDVIVLAKGLDPTAKYEISLRGGNNRGVDFGPKENVNLRLGTMVGETVFQPNQQGELFVSMKNPLRIISKAKEVRVVVSIDGKEVLRSEPFIMSNKTP